MIGIKNLVLACGWRCWIFKLRLLYLLWSFLRADHWRVMLIGSYMCIWVCDMALIGASIIRFKVRIVRVLRRLGYYCCLARLGTDSGWIEQACLPLILVKLGRMLDGHTPMRWERSVKGRLVSLFTRSKLLSWYIILAGKLHYRLALIVDLRYLKVRTLVGWLVFQIIRGGSNLASSSNLDLHIRLELLLRFFVWRL